MVWRDVLYAGCVCSRLQLFAMRAIEGGGHPHERFERLVDCGGRRVWQGEAELLVGGLDGFPEFLDDSLVCVGRLWLCERCVHGEADRHDAQR